MSYKPGDLVAVMGGTRNDQVRRVCRVISVIGDDVRAPEPWEGVVKMAQLRPIVGDK